MIETTNNKEPELLPGEFNKRVEKSLRKKFHKDIWCRFTKAINEYVFNEDTTRQVLEDLMAKGIKTGGDKLGKTIIFAYNKNHAQISITKFHYYIPPLFIFIINYIIQ